ncbi:hypothetical protein ID853_14730 [Xenorhabdus sp. Vera]|uniref:hypothetical protein n=1 Tax=Xenorhabdus koppenhoeferi TaxID=351659 RepID=UPI0019C71890|nr:hypothetical protein [Xenorhabdus sp. Vera]MBD2812110.1 hypothetical protein [Xenorhabdus sp. Vera]
MNTENVILPSNEEMQNVFEMSQNQYKKEISHYEMLVKEKPELAHLFAETLNEEASTSPVLNLTESVNGYFNINTFYQYGYYPFIQVSSYPVIIGNEQNVGKRTHFNGYVHGGYNQIPQVSINNVHLSGVVRHAQTIINASLNFQVFINPKNIVLRLYRGNVYLGDLFSVYQSNLFVTHPLVLSGVGSFTLI